MVGVGLVSAESRLWAAVWWGTIGGLGRVMQISLNWSRWRSHLEEKLAEAGMFYIQQILTHVMRRRQRHFAGTYCLYPAASTTSN